MTMGERFNFSHSYSISLYFYTPSYPPKYIYNNFKKFFINNLSPTSIMPLIATQNHFTSVRSYALNAPIAIQHQIVLLVAKTIDPLKNEKIDDPLVLMCMKKERKTSVI
jgi:hypothetical protein